MSKTQKALALLILLLVVGLCLLMFRTLPGNQGGNDPAKLLDAGIVLLPQKRTVPNLQLIGQEGKPFHVEQLKGKWSLVFFGYTFCPDICPTTLAQLRQLKQSLAAEDFAKLQVVMISVDPKRDTPERLTQYMQYFDPAFIGLTGELETLQALSNTLSIPFIPGDTKQEYYTVDHSGNLAILDPEGRQAGFIRAPFSTEKLAERLPALVR